MRLKRNRNTEWTQRRAYGVHKRAIQYIVKVSANNFKAVLVMGAVVCMCSMPGMLRGNVLQIPCWYV